MKDESKIRDKILSHINKLRKDPKSFVQILQSQIELFEENILYRKNTMPIYTSEGVNAFKAAITYLNRAKALPEFTYSEALEKAAEDLILSKASKQEMSHISADGETMNDRITKYTEWDNFCAEFIEIVQNNTLYTIVDMVVCDGDANRTKRDLLFDKKLKNIGIAFNVINEIGPVAVILCAGDLRNKGEPAFDYGNFKEKDAIPKGKSKIVNNYQYADPDAPDNAVELKVEKEVKAYEDKPIEVTKNIYTLDDGSQKIVEIERFIEV